jgi:prenyltransferase beta subunit
VRLEEYNFLDHESVERIAQFLFSIQNNDGSWEEPAVIDQFNPPSWMKPGDLKAKVLSTAYTSFWLAKLNYTDRDELHDAIDFLMKFVHPDGHFYGFLHTNWNAAAFLAMMLGKDHWAVRGALSYLKGVPSDSWVPSQLGWLLWCLASAGFSAKDPDVKYFLSILNRKQWEDGSFEPENEGKEVETTIEIIKALKLLGLIERT